MQPSGAIFLRKFKHGGREDKGLVHVAALLTDSIFLIERTCLHMTLIERMVAAGMDQESASETAMWYIAQVDEDGLESYVVALESLHDMDSRRGIRTLQP